jgi:hypothetical protein
MPPCTTCVYHNYTDRWTLTVQLPGLSKLQPSSQPRSTAQTTPLDVRWISSLLHQAHLYSDRRGNRTLIIINCVNILVMYPATKAYYVWRNRQRAKIWDAMSTKVCFIIDEPAGLALNLIRNENIISRRQLTSGTDALISDLRIRANIVFFG